MDTTANGAIERLQTSWSRWDPRRRKLVTSHPWLWFWTDPEGTVRSYSTKREAVEARALYG